MSDRELDSSERNRLLERAFARWGNEGGAGEGGRVHLAATQTLSESAPLSNAKLVQLQVRVIALENLLAVLLTETSGRQLDLAREMAAYISPRPGYTPHHLTIHAAARMISLIDGAGHLRDLSAVRNEADKQSGEVVRVDPGRAGDHS
jgi:hypothetical protein